MTVFLDYRSAGRTSRGLFDGATHYVELTVNIGAQMAAATLDWTLAMECNATAVGTNDRFLYCYNNGGSNFTHVGTDNQASPRMGIRVNAGSGNIQSGVAPTAIDTDYHLCVGADQPLSTETWRNGTQALSGAVQLSSGAQTRPLIGSASGTNSRWAGQIWNVRIWWQRLSATDMELISNGGTPATAPDHHWPINEGSGTNINDIIGSEHGTLFGDPNTFWVGA